MSLPFNLPHCTGAEPGALRQVLRGRHLCGDGDFSKKCHRLLERMTGASKALLVHSGTAALEMAAMLIDCKPGDEVIMPSFTFVSTANAFVLRGGVPVFTDISPDTQNIDARLIERAITERTRAICVVHYAGVACDMDAVMAVARRHGLYVIEDAAQAFGSTYKGKALGTIGDLGCYSFHETKNIICGEGGALLINNPALAKRAEILREKGTNRTQFVRGQVDKYTWLDIGSSYLPSELVAAYLYEQLLRADEIKRHRLALWGVYHRYLQPLAEQGVLQCPAIPSGCEHNAHMYYALMPSERERGRLMERLAAHGIQSATHYVPLHSSPAGRRFGKTAGGMTHTERTAATLVRLPLFYDMEERDCHEVLRHGFGIETAPPRVRLSSVAGESATVRDLLRDWRNSEQITPYFILPHITEQQHREWLERCDLERECAAYVIYADEEPIGLVYFSRIDRERGCGEIGIYIYNRAFQELHPARFAYREMLRIARTQYGLERVYARILADNERSLRFHREAGFTFDHEFTCDKNGADVAVHMYTRSLI